MGDDRCASGSEVEAAHRFRGEEGLWRITLSDPARLRRLLTFLAFDPSVVVSQVGEREVEVSFLGSLNLWAQRRELELRLRAWLAAHPDVIAVVSDGEGNPHGVARLGRYRG